MLTTLFQGLIQHQTIATTPLPPSWWACGESCETSITNSIVPDNSHHNSQAELDKCTDNDGWMDEQLVNNRLPKGALGISI